MARLKPGKRARLPDRAFAYVDAGGRRRLPIHDKAHVRNALARFSQVAFEDHAAREQARKRLLNAAKKFRIVPVGFITGQLESEGRRAPAGLPRGFVTLLMTDIEGSTGLLRKLGKRYGALLKGVRAILRRAMRRARGREIDARADEFFAVFEQPTAALEAAVAMQRELARSAWSDDVEVRVRVGIHSGRPTLSDSGYIGLAVHTTARVCSTAHGGQIVVSAATRTAVVSALPAGMRFRSLGRHRLAGLPETEALFQLQAEGLRASFPRLRTGRRAGPHGGRADDGARMPEDGQLELPVTARTAATSAPEA
jgi:class 3 adenylate cyclase